MPGQRSAPGEADTALLALQTLLRPDAPPQARPVQSLTCGFPRLLARSQGVPTSSSYHLVEAFRGLIARIFLVRSFCHFRLPN